MNALADEVGFLVLYPEQSNSANFNRCWNWHRVGNGKRDEGGEPAVIAALTRHVIKDSRANPARVYIAGLSAGAVAAAVVAAEYPELYAAVGVHSGLARGNVSRLSEALAAMRGEAGWTSTPGKQPVPLPTIVFHGDRDDVVHPSNAQGFLKQLEHAKPGALTKRSRRGRSQGGRDYTCTLYRAPLGRVLLEDWTVHGGGHAWSGGKRGGSYTDPAGPDASREMVRFFLARTTTRSKVTSVAAASNPVG